MNTDPGPSASVSLSEKQSIEEKSRHATAETREVDAAAQFSVQGTVDPAESLRIRRKLDKHVLSLMCLVYLIAFMDKAVLGNSAVLGIKTDTHLNDVQYNWLGTIYFVSYIVFEYPQSLALQRFPVGKWLSFNIFLMSIALCLQAACKNFAGLFVLRFLLGMCECSVDSGLMIVTSMFYTRTEQTRRVGYWFLMNGAGIALSGFLAFGALYINTPGFHPWQWLVIICGVLTLITAISFWFFFPDSPTTAWFLTPEERVTTVNRIKGNQAGVENKHFKKDQLMECLTETKTWIFASYSLLRAVPNSLINQNSLIIQSFGFNQIQTTLLSSVIGIVKIVTMYTGVNIAAYFNSIAYTSVAYYIPIIVCAVLVSELPFSNKAGLLVSQYIVSAVGPGAPLGRTWINQTTAGHTKRITMNAILLIAESVGNAIGPQMWLDKFAPRYHVPWAIVAACYGAAVIFILVQRYMLNRENKKRDREPPDDKYDDVWVEITDGSGNITEKRVDKALLDLTDKQNRDFRYPL